MKETEVCCLSKFEPIKKLFEPNTKCLCLPGITLCMAFLWKEKCFQSAPINGGSDGTYKVAFAITQFASGSKSTSVLIMQS